MRLSELAFACYVYEQMTEFDVSYRRFADAASPAPDLAIAEHRRAMLEWLNQWGCRQFAIEHHGLASDAMAGWYQECASLLPPTSKDLWELSEAEMNAVGRAYESLLAQVASLRTRGDSSHAVTFGPAGAAKILFALRPQALVPWDEAIRVKLGHGGNAAGYTGYLRAVKGLILDLGAECKRYGFGLGELPRRMGRFRSTVPKLIDEYYWVTITSGCEPPPLNVFHRWAEWSGRQGL